MFKQISLLILLVISAILVIAGLQFVFTGQSLLMDTFFLPKFEKVRRETFEQSKAYRQGMVQELQNMQFEYVKADPAHQAALAYIIKHRAADFPKDDMPSDLAYFIKTLP